MIKIIFVSVFLFSVVFAGNQKPVLTVYTYASFAASWGPAPKIKKLFEKKCNCVLNFISAPSAITALRRIQLEGRKTKADVLLGIDTSILRMANETGLFLKHGIKTSGLNLPTAFDDENFLPFDYSYFAFVYDSKKIKNPPTSLESLLSMPKNFKIVIQDPRSSTPGLGLLLWVKTIYKDKAADYWKKLSPYILTITKGWSEAYALFLKGEADMVLSYTTSPAYHRIVEKKTHYRAANFKEGLYVQIEVAGILKSTKNETLAKKFLAFTQREDFANIIPTGNWVYPVLKTKQGLPKAFSELIVPSKILLMDGNTLHKNRKAYINEWLKALAK